MNYIHRKVKDAEEENADEKAISHLIHIEFYYSKSIWVHRIAENTENTL